MDKSRMHFKNSSLLWPLRAAPVILAALSQMAAWAAKTAYVVPGGSGDMDGTSWGNAYASIEDAYADVGSDAAGGTVCVAGGTYLVSAPMPMRPNVAVVGGFGGETILSGDNGKADVWRRNNSTAVCAIFDAEGDFVEPAPAAEDEYWTPYDPSYSSTPDTGFCFTNAVDNAENATFANLTFTCFYYGAISTTSGLADGLVVTNCRFLANNPAADRCVSVTPATVYIANSAARVLDSEFTGNNFGLRFHSDSRVVTNLVRGCAFTRNNALRQNNINGGAGGCEASGFALLDIHDSAFTGNVGYMGNSWGNKDGPGGLAFFNGGPKGHVSVVSNCVFNGNFTKNQYSYAGAVQLNHASTNAVAFVGCLFTNNFWKLSANTRGSACIVSGSEARACGTLFVRDTLFVGNVMSNAWAGAASQPCSSAWTDCYGSRAYFVNCTFRNNLATAPNETGGFYGTVCVLSSQKLALVNCAFVDNDSFTVNGARASDIAAANVWNSTDLSIVNCVLWHAAADYVPLPAASRFANKKGAILGGNAMKNNNWDYDFSAEGNLQNLGFKMGDFDNSDPLLLSADRERNGVFARGISSRSPRRKAGVDVYCGDDGLLYVKWTEKPGSASKPWTCLTQHMTQLTPAQALALGVSEESPMPRDAFGNERVAGRMAIGPLNPASPGTTFSVK